MALTHIAQAKSKSSQHFICLIPQKKCDFCFVLSDLIGGTVKCIYSDLSFVLYLFSPMAETHDFYNILKSLEYSYFM